MFTKLNFTVRKPILLSFTNDSDTVFGWHCYDIFEGSTVRTLFPIFHMIKPVNPYYYDVLVRIRDHQWLQLTYYVKFSAFFHSKFSKKLTKRKNTNRYLEVLKQLTTATIKRELQCYSATPIPHVDGGQGPVLNVN